MKLISKTLLLVCFSLLFSDCSSENYLMTRVTKSYNYLALGDSYTYGQSVCESCRFPEQLKDSILQYLNADETFQIKLIAETGWTTTNLQDAIASENLTNDYDLVTLLIGVNNLYQNQPFGLYEQEFPELVNQAIGFAKGDKDNVIVVSIPDYAFTPYGQGGKHISNAIDKYNTFAENYCRTNHISFVNITDITRLGLQQPELIASDGLHPSSVAYSKFIDRILPLAKIKLLD